MVGKTPGVSAHIKLGAIVAQAKSTSSFYILQCNVLAVRKKEPVSLKNVLDELIQIINFTKS